MKKLKIKNIMYNPTPPKEATDTKELKMKLLELTASMPNIIDPVGLAKEMFEWLTDGEK